MDALDAVWKLVSDAVAYIDLGNVSHLYANVPNFNVILVLSFLGIACVVAIAIAVFWPVHRTERADVEGKLAFYKQFYSVHRSIRLP